MSNEKVMFPGVKAGETFEVAGVQFTRFRDENGMTAVMPCESVFRSKFGDSADFKESNVLKRLVKEFLPKIIEAVGEENVCTFKTDLTTLDGLKTYGELESKISLPTLDFYRANVDIFDLHKVRDWPWLATAWSAEPHYDSSLVLCVSSVGIINFNDYGNGSGVRPILYFVSSIFGSCEGVTMGARRKLEEASVRVDLFPALSPLQKVWNRFVVRLCRVARRTDHGRD